MDLNVLKESLEIISGLFTIILVLVTVYYAYQTRLLVRNSHLPFLNFHINFNEYYDRIEFSLSNIGNGYARDIQIFVKLRNKKNKNRVRLITFDYSFLQNGSCINLNDIFSSKKLNLIETLEEFNQMDVKIIYKNILGEKNSQFNKYFLETEIIKEIKKPSEKNKELKHIALSLRDMKEVQLDIKRELSKMNQNYVNFKFLK